MGTLAFNDLFARRTAATPLCILLTVAWFYHTTIPHPKAHFPSYHAHPDAESSTLPKVQIERNQESIDIAQYQIALEFLALA